MKTDYSSIFELKDQPQARDIHALVDSYFAEHWLWDSEEEKARFIVANMGTAGTMTVPGASYERSVILSIFVAWSFLFDDKFENLPRNKENRSHAHVFLDLILGNALPDKDSKLQTATYDITQKLVTDVDEKTRKIGHSILQDIVKWFKNIMSLSLEKGNRSSMTFESVLDYRKKTSGMWILWAIMRWGLAIDVPEDLLNRSEVQKLESLGNLYGVLTNDRYSYWKEVDEAKFSDVEIENVVKMIMSEKGVSGEDAIRDVDQRLQDIEEEFEITERQLYGLLEGQDLTIATQYVQGIRHLLAGTRAFSANSMRYRVDM